MGKYRTKTSGELGECDIGKEVRLAGWVENIRDHGGVSFIDLRDFYGVVQVVMRDRTLLAKLSREDCISVTGVIEKRDEDTYNPKIPTGTIELRCRATEILGKVTKPLPFEIITSRETREEVRLRYRFLDMRNRKVRDNIVLRSDLIKFFRSEMDGYKFMEVQTPILCASSPEGARDFIVPSRKYKGKFYALPQAPQQYKQLLMAGGIDRYFQIAPCFRDEDSRADRTPGEFYQLDFEMSFAEQEDVMDIAQNVMYKTFRRFVPADAAVTEIPFPVITYADAMLRYGTDRPDLRNPLEIIDLSDFFSKCSFRPFMGRTVRAIKVSAKLTRGEHDRMLAFAESIGMGGLGYLEVMGDMTYKGPIDKYIPQELKSSLASLAGLMPGDTIFFIADGETRAAEEAGKIRERLGEELGLIEENAYRFCFVKDFPMYVTDEETGNPVFGHNPFTMPQGGLEALQGGDPLEILAYQYDLVCNGEELGSGAVRYNDVRIMEKVFETVGYTAGELREKFPALYTAFGYGAPPHAGMAMGIERILMLLTGEQSIREVVAFPMNAAGQETLTGAPGAVTEQQLRDVHIKLR